MTQGIESEHFIARFDPDTGQLTLRDHGGIVWLNCIACVDTSLGSLSTRTSGVGYRINATASDDALGSGQRLCIELESAGLGLRLEVVLYQRQALATIELTCTNVSSNDIVIRRIEPVRALAAEGGPLRLTEVLACVTNGEMFSDAGRLHTLTPASEAPRSSTTSASTTAGAHAISSWWNVGLYRGHDRAGLALGYLENSTALGRVYLDQAAAGELSLVAESVLTPAPVLRPGQSIGSNRFALCLAANAHAALERYAEAVGRIQNARTHSIVNGWCSWFYTLTRVTEDEVLRNATFVARHLRGYGLKYVQIDDGYQRMHGDWRGNERFPQGMRWIAAEIRALGLKPGLWIAPYVVSERSELFQQHPEWLVHRPDGSLQRIGKWRSETSPEALREHEKHYCLDITHPGAAEWLRHLFATIASYGYEMVKIDFVSWSILAAERFHDETRSSADVYRQGVAIMRAALGDDCHLLDCGPGNATVGLIDSMRIENDTNYGYAATAWRQYFLDPACSAAAAARRYYFHRRTWINDVDHVCLDLLTLAQAEAVATLIACSGGNALSGDRLVDLDPAKLEVLKKILPAHGEAAVPVDLFEAEMPTTFVLHIERPFARWTVVAFFNADLTNTVERRLGLDRLGLVPNVTYLAFDFWKQRLVGVVRDELVVSVPPASVTLLALHAATGKPQLLSTSRHVMQGAIEIEDARWNEADRTFTGVSLGPPGSAHDVFVFVPQGLPWTWERPALSHEYPGYTVRPIDTHVVRVRVRFEAVGRLPWRVRLEDLTG